MKRIVPILMVFAIVGAAYANGLGGERLEKVIGDQIVDIGTDQTSTPVSGEPIQFDFNLLKSDTRQPLPTTNVTVDIEHNGKTMINSDLIMEPPLTLLVFAFPEGGDYTLKTTFYDKDRSLATASFPIAVAGSAGRTRTPYIAALFATFLLALLMGFWGGRRRRSG